MGEQLNLPCPDPGHLSDLGWRMLTQYEQPDSVQRSADLVLVDELGVKNHDPVQHVS